MQKLDFASVSVSNQAILTLEAIPPSKVGRWSKKGGEKSRLSLETTERGANNLKNNKKITLLLECLQISIR